MSGCQKNNWNKLQGKPSLLGAGSRWLLGYHTNTQGTLALDHLDEPVRAPGPRKATPELAEFRAVSAATRRLRLARAEANLLIRDAPTSSSSSSSCTGTETGPRRFPRLSGMHKPAAGRTVSRNNYPGFPPSLGMHKSASAGRTRNFRASLGFGENSCFVP